MNIAGGIMVLIGVLAFCWALGWWGLIPLSALAYLFWRS